MSITQIDTDRHRAPKPNPLSVYRRERTLDKIPIFTPLEKAPLQTLLELLGERDALRIVLRVRRKLKQELRSQRRQGNDAKWFYNLNLHLTVFFALNQETKLARKLAAHYFSLRGLL